MGVYIKNMEMPRACIFCELYDGELYWCRGAKKEVPYSQEDKRAEFCPLVPVPEHGRVIEEIKVLDIVSEWCPDDDGSVGKVGDLREMLDEIEALPTILEAEEGET